LVRRAKEESSGPATARRNGAGCTQPQLFEKLKKQSYLPGEPGATAQLKYRVSKKTDSLEVDKYSD